MNVWHVDGVSVILKSWSRPVKIGAWFITGCASVTSTCDHFEIWTAAVEAEVGVPLYVGRSDFGSPWRNVAGPPIKAN